MGGCGVPLYRRIEIESFLAATCRFVSSSLPENATLRCSSPRTRRARTEMTSANVLKRNLQSTINSLSLVLLFYDAVKRRFDEHCKRCVGGASPTAFDTKSSHKKSEGS